MSRRRYVSTDISTDARVRQLAEKSEFAALLYTWMIPHALDDATLTADPDELLMLVVPGFRWRTAADIAEALELIVGLALVTRDDGVLHFPVKAFYGYQSYIATDRRSAVAQDECAPEQTDAAKRRKTPQNATPVNSPSPLTFGVAPSVLTPDVSASVRAPDVAAPRRAPEEDQPEPVALPTGAQKCPICRVVFTGLYAEHQCAKIRPEPEDFKGRKRANGQVLPPEVADRLAAPPLLAVSAPEDLLAEHERLLARERSVRQMANAPPPAEPAAPVVLSAAASPELAVQARGSP